ncbi:hypothetical protein Pmar_PMAR019184 [Perkinsus marinus ATCC 50983]|uniref:Uncharacterized protein n=1 Tax=Perkinsus marinus (strain ATCC 50983 / TXsc) TaxID=423536 RepID=C5KU37_PERM5|nr:hypothetical protein Pmar_PMAR019184 [Perkinsus marinus ATCC 50983]EER12079.1 hypothetical protein Pmar_PMAR019184 [Perkinsus marinus ATCC 50983]|eukprot:XP_002780284.1 hypothetical protein Pmar_PMAR019184 [Perkinsus marinus ATCC 50983]
MRIVACLLAIGTTIASDARPNLRRSLSVELPSSPAPVKAKVVNGKCTASFDDLTLEVYANEHNRIATKCLDAET